MEKLLRLSLKLLVLLTLTSCLSKEEKVADAYKYAMHNYQGTPKNMNAFAYALEIDSLNAQIWRELSVPYLKRGIPHIWKSHFDNAVKYDAKTWQPWRGYLYLWFYRDYKKAIADFDMSDVLTPDFIDRPQGQSVDYWRGIAYLGLKDYENSIAYFDKYIKQETEEAGEDWIELTAFLYSGIAYYENGNNDKALLNFELLSKYSKNLYADGKYYKALIYKSKGENDKAIAHINSAIEDFKNGYYNNRAYVETLREIYMEDLETLKASLER